MAFSAPLALQAAGFVGTWDTDVPAGRSTLDVGAAVLLAGRADLADQPVPLEVALARVHPDDRGWVFERIYRARMTGGPFAAEFRVLTEPGDVRWVLNRGSLKADETGAMHGCGAYIDTTDCYPRPLLSAAAVARSETDPLIAAAKHCIEANDALAQIDLPGLKRLSEMLLTEIGWALARQPSG